MQHAIVFLSLVVFVSPATAQEPLTAKELRRGLVGSVFNQMVASKYSDDDNRRLTADDKGRQTLGAIRHSRKQVLSNRVSTVRLSRDGRSFIELKSEGVQITTSLIEHLVIEALDLIPPLEEEKLRIALQTASQKVVEERADDKEAYSAYNGGESKVHKVSLGGDVAGDIAFFVEMHELAAKLPDAEKWSTIHVNFAFIGESETTKDILGR